jgi:hypothetical protein
MPRETYEFTILVYRSMLWILKPAEFEAQTNMPFPFKTPFVFYLFSIFLELITPLCGNGHRTQAAFCMLTSIIKPWQKTVPCIQFGHVNFVCLTGIPFPLFVFFQAHILYKEQFYGWQTLSTIRTCYVHGKYGKWKPFYFVYLVLSQTRCITVNCISYNYSAWMKHYGA